MNKQSLNRSITYILRISSGLANYRETGKKKIIQQILDSAKGDVAMHSPGAIKIELRVVVNLRKVRR